MKAAKTIYDSQYKADPIPTYINRPDILDKNGCKADGSWKLATTILPKPTLKQQIAFIVSEYMFNKPFDLVNTRVTSDNTPSALPDINFNELEFLGISDITPLLNFNNWEQDGIKKILAQWANIVKVQTTGRTTTGTPVQQGTNPAAAGTLPSDTEIAAVTTWRNP